MFFSTSSASPMLLNFFQDMIISINTKTRPREENDFFKNFLIKLFYLMIVLLKNNPTDKLPHSARTIVIKAKSK